MPLATEIYTLLLLSLIVASIAWTVTQEEIFKEWREVCERKSKTCRYVFQRKFFYVFTCEYCFSHWVTLLVIIVTGAHVLFDDWRGYVLAFFLLPWIANQWMSLYRRLRVDIKHENELAKQVEQENEAPTTSASAPRR